MINTKTVFLIACRFIAKFYIHVQVTDTIFDFNCKVNSTGVYFRRNNFLISLTMYKTLIKTHHTPLRLICLVFTRRENPSDIPSIFMIHQSEITSHRITWTQTFLLVFTSCDISLLGIHITLTVDWFHWHNLPGVIIFNLRICFLSCKSLCLLWLVGPDFVVLFPQRTFSSFNGQPCCQVLCMSEISFEHQPRIPFLPLLWEELHVT